MLHFTRKPVLWVNWTSKIDQGNRRFFCLFFGFGFIKVILNWSWSLSTCTLAQANENKPAFGNVTKNVWVVEYRNTLIYSCAMCDNEYSMLFKVIQATFFFYLQHFTHILKRLCVKVTVEKAVIVQTKEQILEETFIDSHLCVWVWEREQETIGGEALRQCEVEVRPRHMALALWPVPWLTHHAASWRQRTFWPWWVLTPVTFGCCQDPLI